MTFGTAADDRQAYRRYALRQWAYWGARYGPRFWLEYSPGLFGLTFAAALPQMRWKIRDNLRCIHGRRSRWVETVDIARTFVQYAHCFAESLALERNDARRARCVAKDSERLTALLREPGGMVIVTAHSGSWDVAAAQLFRLSGRELTLVMEPESDQRSRSLHDALRLRQGLHIVHAGGDALCGVELFGRLRTGAVVAIQIDRAGPGRRTVSTSLFGQAFSMPLGPFLLAAMAEVPLVPIFAARRGYFEYEVFIGAAQRLPKKPAMPDLEQAGQRVADDFQSFLHDHPTSWFHFVTPATKGSDTIGGCTLKGQGQT